MDLICVSVSVGPICVSVSVGPICVSVSVGPICVSVCLLVRTEECVSFPFFCISALA